MERVGVITLKGGALTLLGEEIKVGQTAPDFLVLNSDLEEKSNKELKGKIKVISSVPSLDTPICDLQIKRFNDEAAEMSKDVSVTFISMDLPFAQKRFCDIFSIKKVKTFSDHKDADFGIKFGVLIKELRLLSRAVFIIDQDNIVQYVEYVKEISSPPDYDAALDAIRKLVQGV